MEATARSVVGFDGSVLEAIQQEVIPRPSLMTYAQWRRWRSGEGMRPRLRRAVRRVRRRLRARRRRVVRRARIAVRRGLVRRRRGDRGRVGAPASRERVGDERPVHVLDRRRPPGGRRAAPRALGTYPSPRLDRSPRLIEAVSEALALEDTNGSVSPSGQGPQGTYGAAAVGGEAGLKPGSEVLLPFGKLQSEKLQKMLYHKLMLTNPDQGPRNVRVPERSPSPDQQKRHSD